MLASCTLRILFGVLLIGKALSSSYDSSLLFTSGYYNLNLANLRQYGVFIDVSEQDDDIRIDFNTPSSIGSCGTATDARACQLADNFALADLTTYVASGTSSMNKVSIIFEGGDGANCQAVGTQKNQAYVENRQMLIDFIYDPSKTTPSFTFLDENTICQYHMQLVSSEVLITYDGPVYTSAYTFISADESRQLTLGSSLLALLVAPATNPISVDFASYSNPALSCHGTSTNRACQNGGYRTADLDHYTPGSATATTFTVTLTGGDDDSCAVVAAQDATSNYVFNRQTVIDFIYDATKTSPVVTFLDEATICSYHISVRSADAIITNTGSIKEDPHFTGFNGVKYDVMGAPGLHFNLISEASLQINSLFASVCAKVDRVFTVFTEVGIMIPGFQIEISLEKGAIINGVAVNSSGVQYLGKSHLFIQSDKLASTEWYFESKDFGIYVETRTSDWTHVMAKNDSRTCIAHYLNLEFTKLHQHGVDSHGLVGQTASDSYIAPPKFEGKYARQGQGVIEGQVMDYFVDGLFSTDFKFNKYKQL